MLFIRSNLLSPDAGGQGLFMEATLVFVRTALSREPAMLRMLGLTPTQRWLLELIDGHRSFAQLVVVSPALSRNPAELEQLRQFGLITPQQVPQAVKPQARTVPSKPPRDDAHLIARLLATKPVTENRLTRAAYEDPAPGSGRHHA